MIETVSLWFAHNPWRNLGAHELAVTLFGIGVLAKLVARVTVRQFLPGPLLSALSTNELCNDPDRTHRLNAAICALNEVAPAREGLHWASLTLVYLLLCAVFGPSLAAFSATVIISLLWVMAAVDREHRVVDEMLIFILALAGAFLSLAPAWPFTTPALSVSGLALVLLILLLAMPAANLWRTLAGRSGPGPVSLGSGDVLLVSALALSFGADVLTIVFLACLLVAPLEWRSIAGNAPRELNGESAHIAFIPALLLATGVALVFPHPAWLSFNTWVNTILTNLR